MGQALPRVFHKNMVGTSDQRASTVAERKIIAQEVLASIFNYWSAQGVDLHDEEERTKVRSGF